jgi:hypothetical protein
MTEKRTDAEMFDAILDHAEMDAIRDDVEGQTDEQIKASLAKDGYTDDKLAELARKQRALLASEKPTNVRDIRTARKAVKWSTTTLLFAAGLSFASAAGTVLALGKTDNLPVAFKPGWTIPSGGVTASGVPEPLKASDIRDNAYREFFQHRYADCLQDLDTAKGLDPQGDTTEPVQNLRAEATARMKHGTPD